MSERNWNHPGGYAVFFSQQKLREIFPGHRLGDKVTMEFVAAFATGRPPFQNEGWSWDVLYWAWASDKDFGQPNYQAEFLSLHDNLLQNCRSGVVAP